LHVFNFILNKTKIRVGDTLWSVLRRKPDSSNSWESSRIGSEEQAAETIAKYASAVIGGEGADGETGAEEDAVSLVIYLKRGCIQSYAAANNLHKHMSKCCPEMLEQMK
jgi:hypothetical protein